MISTKFQRSRHEEFWIKKIYVLFKHRHWMRAVYLVSSGYLRIIVVCAKREDRLSTMHALHSDSAFWARESAKNRFGVLYSIFIAPRYLLLFKSFCIIDR